MSKPFVVRERTVRSIVDPLMKTPQKTEEGLEVVLWADLLEGIHRVAKRRDISLEIAEAQLRPAIQTYLDKKGGHPGIYWSVENRPGPQGGYRLPTN